MDDYYYTVHLKDPISVDGCGETYVLDFDKKAIGFKLLNNMSAIIFYDAIPSMSDTAKTLAVIPMDNISVVMTYDRKEK